MKKFIEQSKGQRMVAVEEPVHDRKLFLRSAKPLKRKAWTAEEVLSEQEALCLKKQMVRVRGEIGTQDEN